MKNIGIGDDILAAANRVIEQQRFFATVDKCTTMTAEMYEKMFAELKDLAESIPDPSEEMNKIDGVIGGIVLVRNALEQLLAMNDAAKTDGVMLMRKP